MKVVINEIISLIEMMEEIKKKNLEFILHKLLFRTTMCKKISHRRWAYYKLSGNMREKREQSPHVNEFKSTKIYLLFIHFLYTLGTYNDMSYARVAC